jgi:SAM-dependent methyltransferase
MKKRFIYIALTLCSLSPLFLAALTNYDVYYKTNLVPAKEAKTLIELLNSVEFYQPLYNINFGEKTKIQSPKREETTIERSNLIYNYLKKDIKNSKVTVLDIGSSLGYVSMFLADRGADVVGIDSNAQNVEVANLVANINKLKNVKFQNSIFDLEYVDSLNRQYDVAILFSVIHHIINAHGLEYAQKLMCNLLNKVPMIFVELAISEEDVPFKWKESLPKDPLKVFEPCDCSIEKLSEYDTHLSNVKRPLYLIKKKQIAINKKRYNYSKLRISSYAHDDPNRVIQNNSRFYQGDEYFIKEVHLQDTNKAIQSLTSLSFYFNNAKVINNLNIPKLLDFYCDKNSCFFLYENIKNGINVAENLKKWTNEEKKEIIKQLSNIITTLEDNNIYPKDIRPWNTMVQKSKDNKLKVYLIDFDEFYNPFEKPKMLIDILWMMYELTFEKVDDIGRSKDITSQETKDFGLFAKVAEAIKSGEINTIKDLRNYDF